MARTKSELRFKTYSDFPTQGSESQLYVATNTNLLYRWDGSAYVLVGGGGSGTVNTDGTLTGDGSVVSPLGLNLSSINTWGGEQSFNAGTAIGIQTNVDYLAQDVDILHIGNSTGQTLRFRWASIFGTGGNEFRLDDSFGTLQPLYTGNLTADNVYTGAVVASSTIDGTVITASIGFSGTWAGNTIPVSRGGTGTGTTFNQNSIVLAGVSGVYTQDLGFIFNQSTKRLLISNASITPQNQLHLHQSGATAIYTQYTNSATGSASTDGLQIGITSTGVAEIRQRENQTITLYVNNSLRTTWATGGEGQLIHDGSIVHTRSSIGTTDSYGIRSENQASATAVSPAQQPALWTQTGHVWDTGALATRVIGFSVGQTYTSGNPGSGVLRWGYQYNTSGSFVATGFSTLMNLSSTGNLGIGTGNTVATARLQVNNSSSATNLSVSNSLTGSSFVGINLATGNKSWTIFNSNSGVTNALGFFDVNNGVYRMNIEGTNGNVFIGTGATTASARLHVVSTTEQQRIGYDTSNYFTTTVSSAGAVTFDAVGASAGFTFSDSVNITSSLQCDSIVNDTGLAHGTYTPTLTGVTNVSSSTARLATYMRVGNTVTVSGQIDITPTSNNTRTTIGISLPIASAFTTAYQCGGVGHTAVNATAGHGAAIYADATNDRAEMDFYETNGVSDTFTYTFTYQVI